MPVVDIARSVDGWRTARWLSEQKRADGCPVMLVGADFLNAVCRVRLDEKAKDEKDMPTMMVRLNESKKKSAVRKQTVKKRRENLWGNANGERRRKKFFDRKRACN